MPFVSSRSATVSRECERSSYTQSAPMSAPISLSYRRELAPGLARETPPFSQPSPFYHSTLPTLGLQGRLPK
ncbi:hypothetical protein AAFF_G00157640 [Aldrovandia affinis]|uniref:Uncharacterized protein n=1 Tax=Aldrovandia affinis TaxID=143900 RepID=A0AAD7W851_9TELE|nr:hypothetical protein AAFF_G00157640 [Aldrovandia affinis]